MARATILATIALLTTTAAGLSGPGGAHGEVDPLHNGGFELFVPADTSGLPSSIAALPRDLTCDLPVPELDPFKCYTLADPDLQSQGGKPLLWSTDNAATRVVEDSPTAHHAWFLSAADAAAHGIGWSGHRMWQSLINPAQQAVSGDFASVEFDALSDITPRGGTRIQISYAETPVYQQSPWTGIYIDDFNTFYFTQTIPAGTRVVIDAVHGNPALGIEARFTPSWAGADAAPAFNAPGCDDSCKRDILAGLRQVQFSFWGFMDGAHIDNVTLRGHLVDPAKAQVNPVCPPEDPANFAACLLE